MRSIAVINQKGGVGKTTTTVNLGAGLARRGYRVLLLDMDPQANLTVHVDKRPDLESNTLTNLMVEDAELQQLVQPTATDGLFVVPSDTSLAGVEQVLANRIGRETILREALQKFAQEQPDRFDFLLLDCPPSLGVLSANALVAAEHVLIPMQAQYLSLQGMAKLIEVIQLVQKRLNPELKIAMVLPCMVDSRTNLSAEVLREIEDHFGRLLARTRIRNNVKLAEAPSFGRTIFEHAPESNGAQDYDSFTDELLAALGVAPRAAGATQRQATATAVAPDVAAPEVAAPEAADSPAADPEVADARTEELRAGAQAGESPAGQHDPAPSAPAAQGASSAQPDVPRREAGADA